MQCERFTYTLLWIREAKDQAPRKRVFWTSDMRSQDRQRLDRERGQQQRNQALWLQPRVVAKVLAHTMPPSMAFRGKIGEGRTLCTNIPDRCDILYHLHGDACLNLPIAVHFFIQTSTYLSISPSLTGSLTVPNNGLS